MHIPEQALNAQKEATDPQKTVWVGANAGSGKTHVLTERVIRLLLERIQPSKILCLTYTKAAAEVMKTRVFSRLSEWPFLKDQELKDELIRLGQKNLGSEDLIFARRLFAKALETPGGLKIQTIHAFCESLLRRFPLEANIAGYFQLMDDFKKKQLMQEARQNILSKAFQGRDKNLSPIFSKILPEIGEYYLESFIKESFEKRHAFKDLFQNLKERNESFSQYCRKFLKLKKDEDAFSYLKKNFSKILVDEENLAILESKGKANAKNFALLMRSLSKVEDIRERFEKAADLYLTKQGEPRKISLICTKSVPEELYFLLEKKQDVFLNILEKLKKFALLELNEQVFPFIRALITDYETLKKRQGFLDFDDLIYGALSLLRRSNAHLWVQYKLDQGIDHILLDEAQDTDNLQWEIIQILSEEFFSGEGQRSINRTVFAVGDEKQAIYGFRGANPAAFAENGDIFKKKAIASGHHFQKVGLHYSFRSAAEILNAVDDVFSIEKNYKGLSAENEKTVHNVIRTTLGRVDIWEPFSKIPLEEPEDWREPMLDITSPEVSLARKIASLIGLWIKKGKILKSKNRPIRPNDIMVLVRKRQNTFVTTLIRELKKRNVPVAGADSFQLTEHIAIKDLLALGEFLIQPRDDLSLASLFKSPLFQLHEEDLYTIAIDRQDLTLWEALEKKTLSEESPIFQMRTRLEQYRNLIDKMPPFEFYTHILSVEKGREAYLGRFGSEVEDVLDEFLDICLEYQETSLTSMQEFLNSFVENTPVIKRKFDQSQDELRILTVHGAKGLESHIVFLVDFGMPPTTTKREERIFLCNQKEKEILLWAPQKYYEADIIRLCKIQKRQWALEEYRRLLYVGMTRAEDYLLLCGVTPEEENAESWLSIVQQALEDKCIKITYPIEEEITALSYQKEKEHDHAKVMQNDEEKAGYFNRIEKADQDQEIVSNQEIENYPLPWYLKEKIDNQEQFIPPLLPSHIGVKEQIYLDDEYTLDKEKDFVSFKGEGTMRLAVERGKVFHRFFQYLPFIKESERIKCARHFIAQSPFSFTKEQENSMIEKIQDVLNVPELFEFFNAQGQNEVSIKGEISIKNKKRTVIGRIDRLVVLEDKILLGDYKTGFMPKDVDTIPFLEQVQIALYEKLLRPLYPDKEIFCFLIYTAGPKVLFLSQDTLQKIFLAYEERQKS